MTAPATEFRPRPPCRRGGFTFVELMISIALVVVLMLGVNQVFSYTSRAVGSGEAVNEAIRGSRAAGETFTADFRAMVANGPNPTDAPFMVLRGGNTWAWRNAADQSASISGDVTKLDLNGNNVEGETTVPGEQVAATTLNSRDHRTDVFSFFARDPFHRQTGNSGTFVADQTATEAWVWYGHIALPTNSLDPTTITAVQYPGYSVPTGQAYTTSASNTTTNPNNFYATQFTLGRVATLLAGTAAPVYDADGNAQMYLDRVQGSVLLPMGPLNRNAAVTVPAAVSTAGEVLPYLTTDARVDIGNSSIADQRFLFNGYFLPYQQAGFGYGAMGNGNPAPTGTALPVFNNNPDLTRGLAPYTTGTGVGWWDYLPTGSTIPDSRTNLNAKALTRFKCNPFVTKPMSARDMAGATPLLTRGVSQFVVEYAGDYLNQENNPAAVATKATGDGVHTYAYSYGDVTGCWIDPLLPAATVRGTGTDGQIDYVLIPNANAPPSQWQKQVRWYGFPRSTGNHATINPVLYGDVVPLAWHLRHAFDLTVTGHANILGHVAYDVTQSVTATGTAGPVVGVQEMAFEKYRGNRNISIPNPDAGDVLGHDPFPGGYLGDYSNPNVLASGTAYDYLCAWGPTDPKPKLIRITMTLEDPTGRLPDGQTFQYVFQVP